MHWKTLVLTLTTLVVVVKTKYVELDLSEDNEEWVFLTRFCYLSQDGKIKYELTYSTEYGPYRLLLYYNTANQWEDVYNNDEKTCTEKTQEPYISESSGQIINLDRYATQNAGNCSLQNDGVTVYCTLEREFQSSSQRWWYIALARCDDTVNANDGQRKGMYVNFELTLTNGDSLFFKHFSADEFYILQVDMTFLICFALILAIAIICAVSLHERKFFHTTYKLYLAALSLQLGYLFFITLAYGLYANDGEDKYALRMIARVLDIASYLIYILMLILMGKGFTITRGKIKKSGAIKIAVFLVIYTIGYIILFIFEARFMDPGEVLYLYQSPPGYALLALRILAWAWFCYAVFFTLKHFPEKKKFYIPFFIFFTVWFWSNPIVILAANFAIGTHIRATVVNAVLIFIKFVGYLLFLCLTLPCCVGSVFPYHIRTTQITVISADQYPHDENDPDGSEKSGQKLVYGNSNVLANSKQSQQTTELDNGPSAHVEPSRAPNFVDLFLVSHTTSASVKTFRYNRVDELDTPRVPAFQSTGGLPSIGTTRAALPPISTTLSPRPAGLMTTGITTPKQPEMAAIPTSRYAQFETDPEKEENKDSMVGKPLDSGNNPFITKQ